MNLIFIVHCQWESWESWSPCTKTCEGGSQRRTRIIKVQTEHGGESCQGPPDERRKCNQVACPGMSIGIHKLDFH